MNRIYFICLLLVMNSSRISAQFNIEEIKSLVQNNIIAFQLYTIISDKFVVDENNLLKSEYFNGNGINLLLEGQKMQLQFEVKLNQDLFFPDTSFVLYEVIRDKTIFKDSISGNGLIIPIPILIPNSNLKYLVAINKYDRRAIFISGNYFLNGIAQYFNSSMIEKDLVWFISLKLFNKGNIKIRQIKQRKEMWKIIFENDIKALIIPKSSPDMMYYK